MTVPVALAMVFGALVGSFLNVVVYRLPRGEPLGLVRKSRSQCPDCGAIIRWYDNIPLLSYAVLRGRCRACGWRIPVRYPAVEAATAGLFALAAVRVAALGWTPPLVAFIVVAAFSALCVAAAAIDLGHKLLPDTLTLRVGPVIGLVVAAAVPAIHGTAVFGAELTGVKPGLASVIVGLAGAAVGGLVVGAIRYVGGLVVRREAMGLGDVKFMAMAGLVLGPEGVLVALFVAMVGGAVLGLLIWAVTRDREIPFGPFLAAGTLAVVFFSASIRHVLFVAWPSLLGG